MQQVVPGVYTFTGLMVGRVYLLEDEDGLTLIDTGIPSSGNKIIRQLARTGRSIKNVKRILITHAHPDHIGSLVQLRDESKAEVIISLGERATLNGEQPIPRVAASELSPLARRFRPAETTLKAVQASRVLSDGNILAEVMGGLTAVSTPGHAPGHMSFWHSGRRILFCGDVIFNMPRLRLPYTFLTVNMAENKRSIRRIIELEPEVVCFGHGKPLVENATQQLRTFGRKIGVV